MPHVETETPDRGPRPGGDAPCPALPEGRRGKRAPVRHPGGKAPVLRDHPLAQRVPPGPPGDACGSSPCSRGYGSFRQVLVRLALPPDGPSGACFLGVFTPSRAVAENRREAVPLPSFGGGLPFPHRLLRPPFRGGSPPVPIACRRRDLPRPVGGYLPH